MSPRYELLGYHETPVRVRFCETDPYGYLWHGHALAYFEMGRADVARRHGLAAAELLRHRLMIPMVDLSCEFKEPAHGDVELVVQSTLLRPPPKVPILVFAYRVVRRDDGREILRGRTRQVFVHADNGRVTRVPPEIDARLEDVYRELAAAPRWKGEEAPHVDAPAWREP